MKKKILLFGFPVLLLCSCAGNKLANSMWYNATMVNNEGTWGTVVTSMWFGSDSVYTFNGVAVDDSVVVPPYLYAAGTYSCKKVAKNVYQIELNGRTNVGKTYQYSGLMNKKELVMRLSVPGQQTNETFICDPDVKLQISKKRKK